MIHLNIKIFLYLTLLFLCVGCSYNYKKKPIENNNLGSIIINAKSLKVNKDGFVAVGFVKLQTIETCGLSFSPFFICCDL